MNLSKEATIAASIYTPRNPEGDSFAQGGLSDVTSKGTFQYPEAVSMRRMGTGMNAVGMSAIPFRLSSQELPVRSTRVDGTSINALGRK